MSDEEDPEVIADLQLRAYSQHDSTRTRGLGIYDWKPPAFAGSWPCKRPGCKGRFDIQQDDIDRMNMFNRELAKRNEPQMRPSEMAYCDTCRAEYVRTAPMRRRGQVDKLRPLIQQLKESKDPAGEKELLAQIEKMHHPDVRGLLDAITASRIKQPASKRANSRDVLK